MDTKNGCDRRVNTLSRLAVLALALGADASPAQTVYRCESGNKVSYSHEPCVGAKPVDTTPTQGLDKSTGVSRKGKDVRKAELDKMFGDATRPITGLSDQQRATLHRRFKLPHAAKAECTLLDVRLAGQEADERKAAPKDLAAAQTALFESRKRYRDLRC